MKRPSPNQEEHPEIRAALETRFQEFKRDDEAPEDLKQEVFGTLATMQLVADIADLFTVKFSKTELDFLDISTRKDPAGQKSDESEGRSRL